MNANLTPLTLDLPDDSSAQADSHEPPATA